MRPSPRPLALAALLLTACGGPLLFAELELPELGLTLPSREFPASSVDPALWCPADRHCVETELVYDLGAHVDLLTRDDVEYEIWLTETSIAFDASLPGTDLGGVRSVQFQVHPPGAPAPTVIARYERSPGDPLPASIRVTGSTDVDLAPFLDAGRLALQVQLSFDGPTPAFRADVGATFYMKVKLDYGRAAGL